jgi:hypothetical protein
MEGLVSEIELRFTKVDPTDYATQQSLKEEYEALKADLSEMYQAWESLAAGESEVM